MKTPVIKQLMKQRLAHFLVAACLSAAPAARAQTLPATLPADSGPEFAWQKSLAPSHPAVQDHARPTTSNPRPLSAEQQAAMKQAYALFVAAAADQHAGRYAQAEAEARESISVDPQKGMAREILARALEAQGRTQEALHVYLDSTPVDGPYIHGTTCPVITVDADGIHAAAMDLLPYAWLQLNSGHWAQAVAAYNAALPLVGDSGANVEARLKAAGSSGRIVQDGEVLAANSHFSPDVPEPDRLALMIHLARGLVYNGYTECTYDTLNKEAFAEYGKALQLAPASDLANYYYGVGWNNLSPAERKQFGSIQQAKAALEKAVKLAKGPLKAKAQKALLVTMNTEAAAKTTTP